MKLKYKETILDDNDYLLSCICDGDVIYCIIDYSMVADDIVVVHVDGIPRCDTELIQLNKNDTIDHVKNIVHKLYNCKNINIYQKCANSEKFTKLEDCKTVGNYQLKDNDVIKIVEIQNGRVSISTIFDEKDLGYFDFTNTDLVSDIYEKIRKQERSEDFILSLYNQYLDREYFLFQYNIDHETEIKYLQFNKLDCLKERKEITSENKSRMFKAKDNFIDREIFVKKYKFPKENDYSNLLRELNTFRTIKSHQRFVQLFAAYKERNEFYISMEYFARGSLKNILSNKVERQKIESKDMVKWCKQILEGINYLNNRGIIHGNLTTSSVLLDENNDVKLSSFGMSKYVMGTRIVYWCYWIPVNALSNVYRAPEIINKKPFGIRVDVWSFGIILGDIITGQTDPSKIMEKLNTDFTEIIFEEVPSQKYEEKSINETSEDYKESLLENYTKNKLENPERNLTNNFINIHEKIISKQLKEIIGKCLIEDPIERISVKELINNYFIKLN